jgi:hypothetical protein
MKPMFEQSCGLLEGFNFVDEQSRENALWARIWALEAERTKVPFRPPLVLITGPIGCGKSELAARLSGVRESHCCSSKGITLGFLNAIAKSCPPVAVVDEVPPRIAASKEDAAALHSFLTADSWEWNGRKRKGVDHLHLAELRTCLFLTGGHFEIPKDLDRRCVVIRLKERGEEPEMRMVLEEVASEIDDGLMWKTVPLWAFVKYARELGVLAPLIGREGEARPVGTRLNQFARLLNRCRAAKGLRTYSRRQFRFGKRKQACAWVYPIEWL